MIPRIFLVLVAAFLAGLPAPRPALADPAPERTVLVSSSPARRAVVADRKKQRAVNTAKARAKAREYGIAAPYLSTCTVIVDIPCACESTATIGCSPAPPLDRVQRSISNAFVAPIAWFDSLFFTDRDEVETNQSYIRFITGPVWIEDEGLKWRQAVRVRLRVPHLQERLHLLFSSDDENDVDTSVTDRQGLRDRRPPFSPGPRGDTGVNRARAGLGYQILKLINTDVDVDTALRSHTRGELSVRARHKLPQWEGVTTRAILTGFWLQGTGFGSTGRIDNERPVGDKVIVHFDNSVTQLHAVDGVVGDSRVSLEAQLSQRTGISPGVSFRGSTRPRWRADAYSASIVLRQQFFRDWLFYEVEPGENWSRDVFGAFPAQPFIALRLEAQFRKNKY